MKKQLLMFALILSAAIGFSQATTVTIDPAWSQTLTNTDAAVMTKSYRTNVSSGAVVEWTYAKNDMISMLNEAGCKGFRAYPGLDAGGKMVLIFVGVDVNGKDIIGGTNVTLDRAFHPCPFWPCATNVLNTD